MCHLQQWKSGAHFLFTQGPLYLTAKTPAEMEVLSCFAQLECNEVAFAQNAAQAYST